MAEIKSTLELVMERTRHLFMTDEDKQKKAAEDFKEAVGALTGRYLDHHISLDEFRPKLERLLAERSSGRTDAAAEIGRRIDASGENTLILEILRQVLGFDISGIKAILHDFREKLNSTELQVAKTIRSDLLKKGISGNALVPNPESDKSWQESRIEMFQRVREKLLAQFSRLE